MMEKKKKIRLYAEMGTLTGLIVFFLLYLTFHGTKETKVAPTLYEQALTLVNTDITAANKTKSTYVVSFSFNSENVLSIASRNGQSVYVCSYQFPAETTHETLVNSVQNSQSTVLGYDKTIETFTYDDSIDCSSDTRITDVVGDSSLFVLGTTDTGNHKLSGTFRDKNGNYVSFSGYDYDPVSSENIDFSSSKCMVSEPGETTLVTLYQTIISKK